MLHSIGTRSSLVVSHPSTILAQFC